MFVEHQTSSHDPPEIKDVNNDALITQINDILCIIMFNCNNIS